MKRLIAVLICAGLLFGIGAAQQIQTLETTDSLGVRRTKTNSNFTLLDNKILQQVGTKEDPLDFSGPLQRAENTISCPTCLFGEINADDYASLSAAVTAIGGTARTLTVSSPKLVSGNLTSPANITVRITGNGVISIDNTVTLTIAGPFDAPVREVFTGAGSVRFTNGIRTVYPQWFGARMDGTDDGTLDTPGIQKAIDSFPQTNKPHAGGDVPIRAAIVNATILVQKNSIRLIGSGWGVSNEAPYGGFIKWNGSAGIPMILIKNCWNAGVENLRLIGKSTAKPSAAIEYRRENDATVQHNHCYGRRLWIGSFFGYDSDDAVQFDVGLLFAGSIDGDTNSFDHVQITKCTTGVDVQNPNAADQHFDTLKISQCVTGFKANSMITGTNWLFGGNALDIWVTQGHHLVVDHFTTEGSSQFIKLGPDAHLIITEGGFQVDSAVIPGSAIVIDSTQGSLTLINSRFEGAPGYSGPDFLLRLYQDGSAGQNYTRLQNVKGISKNNLLVQQATGLSDTRQIIFSRPPGHLGFGTDDRVYITNNDDYVEGRNDFASLVNVFGGPLAVKQIVAPSSLTATPTGSGATTYSYRVSAVSKGGESLASTAATCVNASSLDATNFNMIEWYPVLGADSYKVYGRSSGTELLIATVHTKDIRSPANGAWVTSFKDDGALTPSGALPGVNSTGRSNFDGGFTIGGGPHVAGILSATATLDFGNTAAQTSSDLTVTVTGAVVGDVVSLGVPHGSVAANSSFSGWVSATDTVTVRFNNYSAGAIDPASGTFRAKVTRF